jgi:hypothetical protein
MIAKSATNRTTETKFSPFTRRHPGEKSQHRIQNPLLTRPVRHALSRAYLRDLRAAEMIAWEMTGGDYLIAIK